MESCSFGLNVQATPFAPSKEPEGLNFAQNTADTAAAGLWQRPLSNGLHHQSMTEYNLKVIRHGQLLSSPALRIAAQHLKKGKRGRRSKMASNVPTNRAAAPTKQLLKYATAVASPLGPFSEWNPSKKEESAESQLTIFYRGAVLVYNGVSLDQAQEIMLVAGNRTKGGTPSSPATSRAQTLALDPMQAGGAFEANAAPPDAEIQNLEVPNCSGFMAPISLTLSIGIQGSSPYDMMAAPSTPGYPTSQFRPADAMAEPNSSAAAAVPGAIPQARKMSIARFIEKRKNRLVDCKPYGVYSKNLII